jgi:MFS transporter, YNFM family, putative membrane transport protein
LTLFAGGGTVSTVPGMSAASPGPAGDEPGPGGSRRGPRLLLYAPQHGHQSATVAILAVVGLAVVGLLAVWIPLNPALERAYGLTPADAATAGVVFAVGFAIGELAAGPIADGYGRRPVLLGGMALLVVTTVVVAASPSWQVYLAARVGQGAAAGTFAPVALTWVAEALPAARRMLGLAVVITAYQASAITGQLYGQVIGDAVGWRSAYVLLAGVYLVATVVLMRRLYEPRRRAAGEVSGLAVAREMGRLLRVPLLLSGWLLSAVLWSAIIALYGGMQTHLPAGVDADPDRLLWIRTAGLVGVLAVPAVLAVLGGRDPLALIMAGVTITVAGLLAQTLSGGVPMLTAGSVAVAGGSTLAISPLTALISQFAPAARASALAIQSFMLDLGTGGGALLSVQLGYAQVCTLMAVAAAAAALLLAAAVWSQRAAGWIPEGQP